MEVSRDNLNDDVGHFGRIIIVCTSTNDVKHKYQV